jgi:N-acetylneuraminate synthase
MRAIASLNAGDIIKRENFNALRPCPEDALSPGEMGRAEGKILSRNLQKGEYLRITDFT